MDYGLWSVAFVDREELEAENGAATNAIDADESTLWHTTYSSGIAPHPHWIDLDFGVPRVLLSLQYLPRQTGSFNGTIAAYEVETSRDCVSWTHVANGTWVNGRVEKEAQLPVPEPTGVLLLGVALMGVSARRQRSPNEGLVQITMLAHPWNLDTIEAQNPLMVGPSTK